MSSAKLLFVSTLVYYTDDFIFPLYRSLPPDQRETASTIMAFFLSSGLLVGSCFSFLWAYVANLS